MSAHDLRRFDGAIGCNDGLHPHRAANGHFFGQFGIYGNNLCYQLSIAWSILLLAESDRLDLAQNLRLQL